LEYIPEATRATRAVRERRGLPSASFNRIIFTGHSLGGAIATLAAADLVSDSTNWGCDVLDTCMVSAITFGQPHSGNAAFRSGYDRNQIPHKRYVNATGPGLCQWLLRQ
jgi:acetyl esterase/lipase